MLLLTSKAFQSDHRVRRVCRMAQIAAELSELDAKKRKASGWKRSFRLDDFLWKATRGHQL